MTSQRPPVLDLTGDPERIVAIERASLHQHAGRDAVIVSGDLPSGRRVYMRVARSVVDSTAQPAPVKTQQPAVRPAAPRVPAPTAMTPEQYRATVALKFGVPTVATFNAGPPTATLSEAERRRLLGATPLGRSVLADERRYDPAGFSERGGLDPARRRELLAGGHLGRALLDSEDRKRRQGR